MPITDYETICNWCGKTYGKYRKRKYHEACARPANNHKMNVRQRLRILAQKTGRTVPDVREQAKLGCEACGMLHPHMRGPQKDNPFPKLRAWFGHLVCPPCFQALPKPDRLSVKQQNLLGRVLVKLRPPDQPNDQAA